jgi:hypothetical protein
MAHAYIFFGTRPSGGNGGAEKKDAMLFNLGGFSPVVFLPPPWETLEGYEMRSVAVSY